MFVTTRKAEI